ncbi:MAG: hypothetical protein KDC53_23335 [Saprospiraceae bacterium]|nr:hypothetical protein [Saprospiraceae bacterium]
MQVRTSILFLTCHFFFVSIWGQSDYPSLDLHNRQIKMIIYPPDVENGFYRAARFDWAGVIGSLQFKNHQYIEHWLDRHDPTNFESATGPVEGFAPIGYEESKPGDPFLIIGVGLLKKVDNKPYHFSVPYEFVDHGKWHTEKSKRKVEMTQVITSPIGWGYDYTKTIRLNGNKAGFYLHHRLKNSGSKPLETTVYNHNFFIIDHEPTGPNIQTRFPYAAQAEGKGFGDLIVIQDSTMNFSRQLQRGENVYTSDITTKRNKPGDYDIFIENLKSKVGVEITADRPLHRLAYWACHSTACPEPFLEIKLQPGEVYEWTIEYRLYEY